MKIAYLELLYDCNYLSYIERNIPILCQYFFNHCYLIDNDTSFRGGKMCILINSSNLIAAKEVS